MNNEKIPCIPPLLHQDKFIIDFKEKAEMFNNCFADQCFILKNKLPATLSQNGWITNDNDFSNKDILKIIRNLDSNKVHGHDMISIRIVKVCDDLRVANKY